MSFQLELSKPEIQAICKIEPVVKILTKKADQSVPTTEELLKDTDFHGLIHNGSLDTQVVAALKKSGRKDVWITLWGISEGTATWLMEGGPVHSVMGASNPADGAELVNAAAVWHLGKEIKRIYVSPIIPATAETLDDAWKTTFKGTADETPPWSKTWPKKAST